MTIKQLTRELQELIDELEEAKTTCPRCSGTGWVTNPEWEEYWQIKMENPDANIEEPSDFEEEICPDCLSNGYMLNDDAAHLLRLLRQIMEG